MPAAGSGGGGMLLAVGLVVILAAAVAIGRRADVRLVLLLAALTLGAVADLDRGGSPFPATRAVVYTFFATFSKESYVLPICSAMAFAFVLRHTGCDRQLVLLLIRPVRRVRALLIPGVVLTGFLVNIPVVSQTSTAVAIGAVVVPLMRAARFSGVTIGASLLLGSSVGGELLNPGAPEYSTLSTVLQIPRELCVRTALPVVLFQLAVAGLLFWGLCARAERRAATPEPEAVEKDTVAERPKLVQALVPLLPVVLLFLAGPPLEWLKVPREWLVDTAKVVTEQDAQAARSAYDSRLIATAMLVGVTVAALVSGRRSLGTAKAFCEGAGYAFTHVITVIVTSACFSTAVSHIGLDDALRGLIERAPGLLWPAAGLLPLGFAALSGSGIGSTQGLFPMFVEPARALGVEPVGVGGLVSLGAAAGRTMSPVAAVALMCATLTGTNVFDLVRRVAPPLLVGECLSAALASVVLR